MHPRTLADDVAVCEQIKSGNVTDLAGRFRTIVNNRPDGEEAGQPTSAQLEAAAHRAGLAYEYIPVSPGVLTDEQVCAFRRVLDRDRRPILAFCRTGNRSTMIWALSQARTRSPEEIIGIASAAGFDLQGLRPRLLAKAMSA